MKSLVGCNINLIYLNQISTTYDKELEHDGVDNILIDMAYNNGPFNVRVFYQIFEL